MVDFNLKLLPIIFTLLQSLVGIIAIGGRFSIKTWTEIVGRVRSSHGWREHRVVSAPLTHLQYDSFTILVIIVVRLIFRVYNAISWQQHSIIIWLLNLSIAPLMLFFKLYPFLSFIIL